MKKSIFLAAVAFVLMSVTASAQFMQSNGGSNAKASVEDVFNTFDLTYSPVTMKSSDGNDSESEELNGLSLNWSQARLLTEQFPVYIQYGAGLQFTWKTESDSYDDYEEYTVKIKSTTSLLTVKVPVNLLYNFAIPNTAVSVMPYVGLNAQIHLLGQSKIKTEYSGDVETSKVNYFSEEDMEEPLNRFVLGWQIGAMLSYNKYFFGVGYSGPVTNLYKEDEFKINTNQVNISLGFKF